MALAARSSSFLQFTLVRRVSSARTAAKSRAVTRAMGAAIPEGDHFTIPDQPARFAKGKAENNTRMLTTEFFDGTHYSLDRTTGDMLTSRPLYTSDDADPLTRVLPAASPPVNQT